MTVVIANTFTPKLLNGNGKFALLFRKISIEEAKNLVESSAVVNTINKRPIVRFLTFVLETNLKIPKQPYFLKNGDVILLVVLRVKIPETSFSQEVVENIKQFVEFYEVRVLPF
jgi:hypothetical protein